jgi:hypothetical protein
MPSFQSPDPNSGMPWTPTARLWAVKEVYRFVEDAGVARRLYIVSDRIRQPDSIVGDARANSLTRGRQPPMLHVAGDELARRRANQMLARNRRLRRRQRHHVLKLIAKAVRAARLVER